MAVYSERPVPVPTPFQSIQYGGNPFLDQTSNLIGESIPSTAVPQTVSGNKTVFNTGAMVPTQQTQTPPSGTTSSPSGFNWDAYKSTGWNDYNAALADYKATGKNPGDSSSGGGGTTTTKYTSLTNDPRATTVLNTPEVRNEFEQSGLNIDQYLAEIDKEYANSANFLNEQEAAIRADQPGIEKNITNQADLLRNKAYTQKEDAQSAARRLYNELQMGYRQRFGGASSAGEAAQALTANEQQRQMAQNNRTYQEAVAQVDLSANQAIQSAQSEFRNQLLTISQNRTQLESEKLQARRQALSDLSDKVFQIQQQRETFKQNLQLMQEQARLQNESNLSSLTTNPTSGLTYNNQQTTASGNQGLSSAIGAIGNTSSGITKNDELKAQGIYPIMTMTDGRTKYSDGIIR